MNNAIPIPIILAILILNSNPKVIDIMLKLSVSGLLNPKLWPYPSHHKKSKLDANSPINPPKTIPASINKTRTHTLLFLVAISFVPPNIIYLILIVYIIYCKSIFFNTLAKPFQKIFTFSINYLFPFAKIYSII